MRKKSARGKKPGKDLIQFPAMAKSSVSGRSRKHVRPRQLMRPWLEDLLDNNKCPVLKWVNKCQKIFSIIWRHASSSGFNPSEHSDLFLRWARHTGKPEKYICKDHRNSKTNFRCALNSLKDCIQLTKPGDKRGVAAKRTYQFIEKDDPRYDIKRKERQKKRNKIQAQKEFEEDKLELDDPNTDSCEAGQNPSHWDYRRNEVISPALDAGSSSPPVAELIMDISTNSPAPDSDSSNTYLIQEPSPSSTSGGNVWFKTIEKEMLNHPTVVIDNSNLTVISTDQDNESFGETYAFEDLTELTPLGMTDDIGKTDDNFCDFSDIDFAEEETLLFD